MSVNNTKEVDILDSISIETILKYVKQKGLEEDFAKKREIDNSITDLLLETLIELKSELAVKRPSYVNRKMKFYVSTHDAYEEAMSKKDSNSLTKYFIQEAKHFHLLYLREQEFCSQLFDSKELEELISRSELY